MKNSSFIQIKNSMKVRKQIIFKIYNLLKKLHSTNKCKKESKPILTNVRVKKEEKK